MTSIMDVAGPIEVFAKTNEFICDNLANVEIIYQTHVVSVTSELIVPTSSGLPIVCEEYLYSITYDIDTLILGGKGSLEVAHPTLQRVIDWVKLKAESIRRICSICVGVFLLTESGLLNGLRTTTHWRSYDKLAKKYPEIQVEKNSIYAKDSKMYSSAGISTGIDLTLALVEEDYGREVSVNVARVLVLYLKRPGNQSQFSNVLMQQKVDYAPIRNIQEWILEHLEGDLTVEHLAEISLMSPRNFSRVFLRETESTPAKYIEKMRLERARRRLEETKLSVEEISVECGIANTDGLRRLFLRHLKTTPTDYRKSFASSLY